MALKCHNNLSSLLEYQVREGGNREEKENQGRPSSSCTPDHHTLCSPQRKGRNMRKCRSTTATSGCGLANCSAWLRVVHLSMSKLVAAKRWCGPRGYGLDRVLSVHPSTVDATRVTCLRSSWVNVAPFGVQYMVGNKDLQFIWCNQKLEV
jgi:hypothetical protein